tara:strand:+ start:205 stop:600 length:396 start_codon:yes stop_codon:yes gene_type:complete
MARFGTTAIFHWTEGDTLILGTGIVLAEQDMFQYPFETAIETDAVSYRSHGGKRYEYQNWSKNNHTLSFVGLRESKRTEFYNMVNSLPTFRLQSPPGVDFGAGTFRVTPGSWSDSETSFERYDVSFTIEDA